MGLFGLGRPEKRGKIADEVENHLTRRDFLKKSVTLGAGAIAASALGLKPEIALGSVDSCVVNYGAGDFDFKNFHSQNERFKRYFSQILPPGILNCRSPDIVLMYLDLIQFQPRCGHLDSQVRFEEIVPTEDREIEPAYHFTIYRWVPKIGAKRHLIQGLGLERYNPPIHFFSEGIQKYFVNHHSKRHIHNPETDFVKSIMYAAFYPEEAERKTREYLNGNLMTKTQIAENAMQSLKNMRGADSKNRTDPNNAYNRRLAASWSAFMLTCYYDSLDSKSGLGELINAKLEVPLRKYSGKLRAHKSKGDVVYGI